MASILEFPQVAKLPTIDASAFSQPHFAHLLARTRRIIHKASGTPAARPTATIISIGEARRTELPFRTTVAS